MPALQQGHHAQRAFCAMRTNETENRTQSASPSVGLSTITFAKAEVLEVMGDSAKADAKWKPHKRNQMPFENNGNQRAPAPTQRPNGAQHQPPASRRITSDAMLSPRQAEIVQLVALGLSDKEIGRKLHLTEGSVGWHLKKIFLKWRVHSRVALAATFLQENTLKLVPSNLPPPPHEREGCGKPIFAK
jgi:DNA-binding CsgD family transcriptional regulator